MTDQLLIAEGVRKVYRTGAETVEALRGVDLVVHEGEFVSVMGPSGSGKTTLLNCCSGLDDIDGGRVLLDGVDLHALSDADLASLAGPRERYALNTAAIRAEYAHIPDEVFRKGRLQVLVGLLDGPGVFRTRQARQQWEGPAQENLRAELATLTE